MKETKFRNIKSLCEWDCCFLPSSGHTQVLPEAQGSWLEDELNFRERIMLLSGVIPKPVMLFYRVHTFNVSSYYNFTASLLLCGGVSKGPASGNLQRHVNLSAISLFRIDSGLYWPQRKV